MRTFTVVPSFEGNTAYFELPDIGFQGDHLSFAILFNLTELVEHWPNIVPSMIVTDADKNTFIAPHTRWDGAKHLFTWEISEVETAYEGQVRCQLKCTAADDPNTIVCMSRICQTRVYPSLEAASDPPEAFQSWLDTLVQLGAEIAEDASTVYAGVEATQENALTAQRAADDAEQYKDDAEAAKDDAEAAAQRAETAKQASVTASQRSAASASDAETARAAAVAAKNSVDESLNIIDGEVVRVRGYSDSAADSATRAAASQTAANDAKLAAERARDAAQAAKTGAETAQHRAETAEGAAVAAQQAAERARTGAETALLSVAEVKAEADQIHLDINETKAAVLEAAANADEDATTAYEAMTRAETARNGVENYAEEAKKWAIGKDRNDTPVASSDPTYENNSKYWSGVSEQMAANLFGFYIDEDGYLAQRITSEG